MEMWVVATAILVAGMIDDLRSRKVHNPLVIALLVASLATSFYFRGILGSGVGLTALVGALLLTVPLFVFGVLGGGDVKLFAVFALCLDPVCMFWTLVYSFIWGAVFGVVRAALQRNLLTLVRATYRASRQRVQVQEVHKVPYTFSLLLGWFTQLTFLHAGGWI
jgi:prepilin peptidase CpaA